MRCSTGRCSAGSSPTRWSARPNCCCRNACRSRRVTVHPRAAEVGRRPAAPAAEAGAVHRVLTDPNTPLPEVHLLSNGSYHVMATHAGGGYSRWRDLAVTRWREDATCDGYGTFIYLRDRDTGRYWSTAYQPTLHEGRSLRGGLRAGARGVPQARSRHRSAHRDQRLARRRRRDPPRHAHQPVRRHPRDRGDELRGGRHGAAECRSRPSRVQQPVRADRDPARAAGHPLQAASPHPGRADAVDVPPAGGARRCRRAERLVRDRPRPVHRPGPNGGQPGGARRRATARRPVEHRGLGARSHRGDPPHPDAVSRRIGRPCRSSPASRRRAKRPWLCSRSIATGTSSSAPSRWPGSRARRCCASST